MRYILITLSTLTIAFLNTGCLSAKYDYDYISKNIKPELKKVNKNICITDISSVIQSGGPDDVIDFELSKTNQQVAENYFKQYFTYVNDSSKKCFLDIVTKVSNIDSKYISIDGMDATFDFYLSTKKDGNFLFEINTRENYSSEVFMTPVAFLGGSAPYKTANEAFHKGLLDVYETKVEEKILESLKEK